MGLSPGVGVLKLKIWYGLDPDTGRWGSPMRQRWGLSPHQEMSPALEDKLAFTVTATRSYEEAAQVAQEWNCPVDDSTLHALTRRLGTRAEQQTQERLKGVARERTPQRADSQLAVFMLDGYLVRYRGPGWGKKKTQKKRVEWHEIKTGVLYFQEQAARTEGGRGVLSEKVVICWQGEGIEVGRRLHCEAQRRGLGRAEWVLVLGDGAAWIWNVAADRWRVPRSYWISITPANTSGSWVVLCILKTRFRSGSRGDCMNCAMERRRSSWPRSNSSSHAQAKSGRRSGSRSTISPIRQSE